MNVIVIEISFVEEYVYFVKSVDVLFLIDEIKEVGEFDFELLEVVKVFDGI